VLQSSHWIASRYGPVGNQLDTIDDRMWGFMKRCWDYNPSSRPHCDEIRQFIADTASLDVQHQVSPLLNPKTLPSWDIVRGKPEITMEDDHIHRILLHILQSPVSATHPSPVVRPKPTYSPSAGPLVGTSHETTTSVGFSERAPQDRKRKEKRVFPYGAGNEEVARTGSSEAHREDDSVHKLLLCPTPGCLKRYRHNTGLKRHLNHKHPFFRPQPRRRKSCVS